jgi:PAS domain S-box-containing protein
MSNETSTILIVDDFPANLNLLRTILIPTGYKIIEASSGVEALEITRQEQPTIILLDIMMPEMDGFDVCRELKNNPKTRDIAIIFVSAKDSANAKVKGLALGAVDFITKPFHQEEVIARVETHISLERTRKRLEESERNYSMLVENIQDGIFLWNLQEGILFSNPAFSNMLGIDASEISLKSLKDIFHPDDLTEAEATMEKILLNKTEVGSGEKSWKMISAAGKTIHTACLPGYVVFSQKPVVLITVRDMTERISLERQLSHTQKLEALGTLTSGIAHDFNNILALINGYSELALLDLEKDSPVREKLQLIHDAGRNAISLTKGLLAFGRKKGLVFENADLAEEIKKLANFVPRGLPKNITFNIDLPDDTHTALADSGMLQQTLINLCLNSRDAMPKGGNIDITLSYKQFDALPAHAPQEAATGKYALISVKDNGTGIPEEILDKIFDPFFSTKEGKGSGLGLAMVHRVVRNHKGWVELDSTPGEGTKFTLFLPVSEGIIAEKETDSAGSKYKHVHNPALKTILAVDDDEVQMSMMQYFLEKYNYQVVTVNSSSDALLEIEKDPERFGLVITDHVMPGMTGGECCKYIRNKWPEIKLLLISGAGNVPLDGDDFLRKPFSAKDLFQKIDAIK